MKRSKGIIGIFAGILPIALLFGVIVGIGLTFTSVLNIFGLVDTVPDSQTFSIYRHLEDIYAEPTSSTADPLSTKVELNKDTEINTSYVMSYNIGDEHVENLTYESSVDEITVHDDSLRGRIISNLKIILSFIVSLLILYNINDIFMSLDSSIKNNKWFQIDVYKSLLKIAYLTIAFTFISFISSLIYYFLLDDVLVNGVRVIIAPNVGLLSAFIQVGIIFVIARVYKEGIELCEEQDLTI